MKRNLIASCHQLSNFLSFFHSPTKLGQKFTNKIRYYDNDDDFLLEKGRGTRRKITKLK